MNYEINMIEKTGTKTPIDTMAFDQINYLQMNDELMKKYNIEYLGDVEIMGKNCKEYKIQIKETGMEATTAVWNGIALRSEAKVMGMTVKINVTKIQENVSVPHDIFHVPEGIDFTQQESLEL
jgi:hypothetical protein